MKHDENTEAGPWTGSVAECSPLRRMPRAAVTGSQAWPAVVTACSSRKIAAVLTVCARVGVSVLCSLVVRCRYLVA